MSYQNHFQHQRKLIYAQKDGNSAAQDEQVKNLINENNGSRQQQQMIIEIDSGRTQTPCNQNATLPPNKHYSNNMGSNQNRNMKQKLQVDILSAPGTSASATTMSQPAQVIITPIDRQMGRHQRGATVDSAYYPFSAGASSFNKTGPYNIGLATSPYSQTPQNNKNKDNATSNNNWITNNPLNQQNQSQQIQQGVQPFQLNAVGLKMNQQRQHLNFNTGADVVQQQQLQQYMGPPGISSAKNASSRNNGFQFGPPMVKYQFPSSTMSAGAGHQRAPQISSTTNNRMVFAQQNLGSQAAYVSQQNFQNGGGQPQQQLQHQHHLPPYHLGSQPADLRLQVDKRFYSQQSWSQYPNSQQQLPHPQQQPNEQSLHTSVHGLASILGEPDNEPSQSQRTQQTHNPQHSSQQCQGSSELKQRNFQRQQQQQKTIHLQHNNDYQPQFPIYTRALQQQQTIQQPSHLQQQEFQIPQQQHSGSTGLIDGVAVKGPKHFVFPPQSPQLNQNVVPAEDDLINNEQDTTDVKQQQLQHHQIFNPQNSIENPVTDGRWNAMPSGAYNHQQNYSNNNNANNMTADDQFNNSRASTQPQLFLHHSAKKNNNGNNQFQQQQSIPQQHNLSYQQNNSASKQDKSLQNQSQFYATMPLLSDLDQDQSQNNQSQIVPDQQDPARMDQKNNQQQMYSQSNFLSTHDHHRQQQLQQQLIDTPQRAQFRSPMGVIDGGIAIGGNSSIRGGEGCNSSYTTDRRGQSFMYETRKIPNITKLDLNGIPGNNNEPQDFVNMIVQEEIQGESDNLNSNNHLNQNGVDEQSTINDYMGSMIRSHEADAKTIYNEDNTGQGGSALIEALNPIIQMPNRLPQEKDQQPSMSVRISNMEGLANQRRKSDIMRASNINTQQRREPSKESSKGLPTATLELSYSHENTTMKTHHNLNTTAMNLDLHQQTRQSKQSNRKTSGIPRHGQDKSDQDIVFLTSSNSVSQSQNSANNLSVLLKQNIAQQKIYNPKIIDQDAHTSEQKGQQSQIEEVKIGEEKGVSKLVQIGPDQVYDNLIRGADESQQDEFHKALLLQMQMQSSICDEESKSQQLPYVQNLQIDQDGDAEAEMLGCNLGTHISTDGQEDQIQQNLSISISQNTKTKRTAGMAPGKISVNNHVRIPLGGHKPIVDANQENSAFLTPNNPSTFSYSVEYNQKNKANSKVQDQLASNPPHNESCNQVNPDPNEATDSKTSNSCSERDSTSSSLSIYQKYPNLPSQLRDILELQNFRIQNMQVEVNTLKEQNKEFQVALSEQQSIKGQLEQLNQQNDVLRQIMTQQQQQHMLEMDSICTQMGPMMEALKLLTCVDHTVDLNQTDQNICSTSKDGGREGDHQQILQNNDQEQQNMRSQPDLLQGLLNRSLLQLKRSPGLYSSYSLTNSKFQLRALQSFRSDKNNNQQQQNDNQEDERHQLEGIDQSQIKLQKREGILNFQRTTQHHHHQRTTMQQHQSLHHGSQHNQKSSQQQIIVTSSRKQVTKIIETSSSEEIIESEIGPARTYFGNQQTLGINQYPVNLSTKFGGRADAYMSQNVNNIIGSEELTQNVECFTDDGDLVMSDDANIPDSARAIPSITQTLIFEKKCKNQIESEPKQRATTKLSSKEAAAQSQREQKQVAVSGFNDQLLQQSVMQQKNPFTNNTSGHQNKLLQSDNNNYFAQNLMDDYHADPTSNETSVTHINVKMQDIKIVQSIQQQQQEQRSSTNTHTKHLKPILTQMKIGQMKNSNHNENHNHNQHHQQQQRTKATTNKTNTLQQMGSQSDSEDHPFLQKQTPDVKEVPVQAINVPIAGGNVKEQRTDMQMRLNQLLGGSLKHHPQQKVAKDTNSSMISQDQSNNFYHKRSKTTTQKI